MNKQQFKILEKLNDKVNAMDFFFEEPYHKRIKNRYYHKLLIQADNLAHKLTKI
jgi:hypothetical protein